jgi:hypothetical protein
MLSAFEPTYSASSRPCVEVAAAVDVNGVSAAECLDDALKRAAVAESAGASVGTSGEESPATRSQGTDRDSGGWHGRGADALIGRPSSPGRLAEGEGLAARLAATTAAKAAAVAAEDFDAAKRLKEEALALKAALLSLPSRQVSHGLTAPSKEAVDMGEGCDVDVVDGATLTPKDFLLRFLAVGRPVLIKEVAAAWPLITVRALSRMAKHPQVPL